MPKLDLIRWGYWLTFGWLFSIVLFRHFPGVDPAITGLFYVPGAGFPLGENAALNLLREVVWNAAIAVFLASGVAWWWVARRRSLWGRGFGGGKLAGLSNAGWRAIFATFLLGPGLIVNAWLKSFSGRARPANTELFGGTHQFTRAGDFSDQCASNCSFVSGEVAAGTALAVTVWFLTAAIPYRWLQQGLRALGGVVFAFVIFQRVATGRHFASDAIFAVLITASIAWIFVAAHRVAQAPQK
ncbi:PAP2 superfamily protein [Rhodobacter aestuarii]|uniref:PAP2 superfamily protein n=1 Tax=Rhodobacter aestuarii TaxID=453582 RepID=A0A1N7PR22_9RHOB|nr:phosphatase PAP2 family protein [Rhodobacter aestuarii]PTV94232.1 PAP2 superfamily protein [Rhodobacter aestuarii]SIT13000.1 PAP2 superfamily protein [Rhodobacter aestuarii]